MSALQASKPSRLEKKESQATSFSNNSVELNGTHRRVSTVYCLNSLQSIERRCRSCFTYFPQNSSMSTACFRRSPVPFVYVAAATSCEPTSRNTLRHHFRVAVPYVHLQDGTRAKQWQGFLSNTHAAATKPVSSRIRLAGRVEYLRLR